MKSKRLNKYLNDQEKRNAESKKNTEENTRPVKSSVENKEGCSQERKRCDTHGYA